MDEAMREYQKWLADFQDDPTALAELKALAGDERELQDRFYKELDFGTGGMRGVMGIGRNRMNVYNVRRATKGVARYLLRDPENAARGVAIGYDSRRMSAAFARETALVLCREGVRAYLFDALRPVALLSFAVRHLGAAAGVVITASHNPPEYNGYKLYGADGAQIGPDTAAEVTREIRSMAYADCQPMDEAAARAAGLLRVVGDREVDDAYMARLRTLIVQPDVLAKVGGELRIVYTPLHGSGNVPVRRALREAGLTHVTVVREQEAPDGDFPTVRVPNPEDPAAFTLAIRYANEVGADAAFATDPDCDRLGVAVRGRDGGFTLLTGNQIGCLLLYYLLNAKRARGELPENAACVKSIVSTELARAICEDFGIAIFNTLTGFKFIGEMIQEFEETGANTFVFGFEESYGYLSGTFVRDKDGVNASLLLAEAVAAYKAQGKTLDDVMNEIYARYGFYIERVAAKTLPGADGLAAMANIMRRLREAPPASFAGLRVAAVRDYLTGTRRADGQTSPLGMPSNDTLYFELEGGAWACVRPSGTEPKIKLYAGVSAKERDAAEQAADALMRAVDESLA